MDKGTILKKIHELKVKQEMIGKTWKQTGNRELLDFFIEIMPRLLSADRCSVFILDPVNNDAWLHSGTGMSEQEIKVPAKSSMVGRVIGSGETLVENDMENQIGAHDTVAIKTGYITYSAICAPIFGTSRQRVIGAIQVLNKRKNGFDSEDRRLLEQAAHLIQMHVENIYARQELMKIASEMSQQIATLESKLRE